MRTRDITQSFKIDQVEMNKLHALAHADDVPIGRMLRKWLDERYAARFGNAPPPPASPTRGRK